MIRSFLCPDTERLFRRERPRAIPADLHRRAYKKLVMLDAASRLDDLRIPPKNHLEALRRDRVGQHSVRINDQWRICFVWRSGDVEIVDSH